MAALLLAMVAGAPAFAQTAGEIGGAVTRRHRAPAPGGGPVDQLRGRLSLRSEGGDRQDLRDHG